MRRRWIRVTGVGLLVLGPGVLFIRYFVGMFLLLLRAPVVLAGLAVVVVVGVGGVWLLKWAGPGRGYGIGRCAKCGYPLVDVPRREVKVGTLKFDQLVCPECGESDEESEKTTLEQD